jgi:hypothetical protein
LSIVPQHRVPAEADGPTRRDERKQREMRGVEARPLPLLFSGRQNGM